MNEMKMKAKKNKKWIKSLRFENLPIEERKKNEERMKNGEERWKTFTDLLTKTSRKRYRCTSAWIFFTKTIFSPKTAEMHSQGG